MPNMFITQSTHSSLKKMKNYKKKLKKSFTCSILLLLLDISGTQVAQMLQKLPILIVGALSSYNGPSFFNDVDLQVMQLTTVIYDPYGEIGDIITTKLHLCKK